MNNCDGSTIFFDIFDQPHCLMTVFHSYLCININSDVVKQSFILPLKALRHLWITPKFLVNLIRMFRQYCWTLEFNSFRYVHALSRAYFSASGSCVNERILCVRRDRAKEFLLLWWWWWSRRVEKEKKLIFIFLNEVNKNITQMFCYDFRRIT